MRWNAEVPGDSLQALSADEPLDGGRLPLRRKPEPPPHARSSDLVETWSFLSVAKARIPCQEIGSH